MAGSLGEKCLAHGQLFFMSSQMADSINKILNL